MAVTQVLLIDAAADLLSDEENYFRVLVTAVDEEVCIIADEADPVIRVRFNRSEWEAINKLATTEFARIDAQSGLKEFDK